MVLPIIHEAKQIVLNDLEIIDFEVKGKLIIQKDPKIIDMILSFHNWDKKVILEEDIIAKIKLLGEDIEQGLTKDLKGLEVIRLYKTLPFYRVTNKIKKKMKYKAFRVSRKIGKKDYEFEL